MKKLLVALYVSLGILIVMSVISYYDEPEVGDYYSDYYSNVETVTKEKPTEHYTLPTVSSMEIQAVTTGSQETEAMTEELPLKVDSEPVEAIPQKVEEEAVESIAQVQQEMTQIPVQVVTQTVYSGTRYAYMEMLTEEEKEIYNQVYENAMELNTTFVLKNRISENSLDRIMTAVYNDHPELFWVETKYSYGYLEAGEVVTVTLVYNKTAENLTYYESLFDGIVNQIVSTAITYPTEEEKIRYVHDTLCSMNTYDESEPMNQSAYSAIVLGKSVCAGYSRAFQYILGQLSIEAYFCNGTAEGGNHAWNIVYLNGAYRNFDVSWNDEAGEFFGSRDYTYYNVNDAIFGTDHVRTGMSIDLPKCE